MAESHRLGDLQVGEAGHHGVGMLLGQIEQGGLQALDQSDQVVDRGAQPQAHVGGHLVVARAGGVQALAGFADQAVRRFSMLRWTSSRSSDQSNWPLRTSSRICAMPCGWRPGRPRSMMPHGSKHGGVGERALNVEFRQALVEFHRSGVAFDQFGHRFVKTARPGFARRRSFDLASLSA